MYNPRKIESDLDFFSNPKGIGTSVECSKTTAIGYINNFRLKIQRNLYFERKYFFINLKKIINSVFLL